MYLLGGFFLCVRGYCSAPSGDGGGGDWQDSHRTPKHRNMYALAAALGPVCLPALTPKEMLIYGENKEKGKCWETRRRFSDVSKWS